MTRNPATDYRLAIAGLPIVISEHVPHWQVIAVPGGLITAAPTVIAADGRLGDVDATWRRVIHLHLARVGRFRQRREAAAARLRDRLDVMAATAAEMERHYEALRRDPRPKAPDLAGNPRPLRLLRMLAGVDQRTAARNLGVSLRKLQHIERDPYPYSSAMARHARACGTHIVWEISALEAAP